MKEFPLSFFFISHVVLPSVVWASGIPTVDIATQVRLSINHLQDQLQRANHIIETVNVVQNTAQQIQNQIQQIQYMADTLQTLPSGGFVGIVNGLGQQLWALERVLNTVESVGWNIEHVRNEMGELYPDPTTWGEPRTLEEVTTMTTQWNESIVDANQVAIEIQTLTGNVQGRTQALQDIVTTSQSQGGEVRQLQAIVQETALVSESLNHLNVQTASLNRAMAMAAVKEVTKEELIRAQRENNMKDYTYMGPKTKIPKGF